MAATTRNQTIIKTVKLKVVLEYTYMIIAFSLSVKLNVVIMIRVKLGYCKFR